MIRFVDLEASSLLPGSFPIEVAWVDVDGRGESHLIRPTEAWLRTDLGMPGWSRESAAVHGISLEQLMDEGELFEEVARLAADALVREDVIAVSDAVGFDGGWLDTLFEAGGVSKRADLVGLHLAYAAACAPLRSLLPPDADPDHGRAVDEFRWTVRRIVARAEEAEALRVRVRHRALPDAESMWRVWRAIGDEVGRRLVAMTGITRVPVAADRLEEGTRVGRFVVLRDLEGRTHAVAATSVGAICETDDGTLLMLPGGRMVQVPQGLATVLGWLDVRRTDALRQRDAVSRARDAAPNTPGTMTGSGQRYRQPGPGPPRPTRRGRLFEH